MTRLAGHMTLGEVERCTHAADRLKMVKLLVEGSRTGTHRPKIGTHSTNILEMRLFLAKF